jgi:endonuclease YncB( thermonuclease family)
VGKIWKPGKETVALPAEARPSRIRRDPVRLDKIPEPTPPSREREIWTAVAGVLAVAACCTALVVGVSQVTSADSAAAAAAAPSAAKFSYCRTNAQPDCVDDGDTFFLAGERIDIAGIDAPELHPSRCREEARRGIQAAVRLRELLNRGPVTLAAARRGGDGRLLRDVVADGLDVGPVMIASGVAREYRDGPRSWC